MYPTFTDKNDEIAIVMRYFNLKHGDVIVVRMTSNLIIKRAVALGGDKISLVYDKESKYCTYYLNDNALDEPYIKSKYDMNKDYFDKKMAKLKNITREETTEEIILTLTLENDELFLLGDNRGVSADSSSTGPVKQSQVLGKVIYKYKG